MTAPSTTRRGRSLGLTSFTALGFVLELFVVEEQLFAGGEDEILTAINALQVLILEFHFACTTLSLLLYPLGGSCNVPITSDDVFPT